MMICARRHCWSWREERCFSLQLPGDTGIFHVAKNLPSFAWHPSSLYSILWWRLHRALTWPAGVFCALLYRCGRSPCLRLQLNAATARYQTVQPGSFWRQASTSHTVSWGSERTSPGAETQAQNVPVLGPVHIAEVVPEQYRYVGSAVYVNALCRQ